jgi:hypothetical protein
MARISDLAETGVTTRAPIGERIVDFLDGVTLLLGHILWLAPLIGGLGLFGWQVFHWLYAGEWSALSLLDVVRKVGPPLTAWADQPTKWIGVWKVLCWLPAALAGVVFGTVTGIAIHTARNH